MTHDIVYLLKDGPNEELRFSLRSVEKNFPHRIVCFAGGRPIGLEPDIQIDVQQDQGSKWNNTRKNLLEAVRNDRLTPDIWLFNDDFFIMGAYQGSGLEFDGELKKHILEIEGRHNGNHTTYTLRLRQLCKTLAKAGIHTPRNYAIHRPMLINREKAQRILETYSEEPMFRALYGNLTATEDNPGKPAKNCKVTPWLRPAYELSDIISTEDQCFERDAVGRYIRERFTEPSRWEV
jgi:hypothetical protein